MKKYLILFAAILLGVMDFSRAGKAATLSCDDLARYYAPVIYQEVASSDQNIAKFDRITSVDFDGDFDPSNNIPYAESTDGSLPAALYYFTIEGETHCFLYYFPYHVWTNEGGLSPMSHEFDGIMEVIYKDGTKYGNFTGLEVFTNGIIKVFKEQTGNDIESGSLYIGGGLDFYDDSYSTAGMYGNHPVLYASTAANGKGHALRNWVDGIKTDTQRLIAYYYDPGTTSSDAPAVGSEVISNDDLGGDISNLNATPYELIPITDTTRGIWTFATDSRFEKMISERGNYYGYVLGWPWTNNGIGGLGEKLVPSTYAGNTVPSGVLPWFFDASGDGSSVLAGDWFFDPTRTFNAHVIINQNYSFNYVKHPLLVLDGMYLDTDSPNITSYPPKSVTLGNTYIYDVNASGSDTLTYGLLYAPPDMSINSSSGYIQWTPQNTGNYHVIVSVDNGHSFMLQHFTINVVAPPPPSSGGGEGGGCDMGSGGGIFYGFILMILLPLLYKFLRKQPE